MPALVSAALPIALLVLAHADLGPPSMTTSIGPEGSSTDGTFSLAWGASDPEGTTYQVELAMPPPRAQFEPWYEGEARESFVSGVPSGLAKARVRRREGKSSVWSEWSKPTDIRIEHHSMTRALGLLALGGAIFLAILSYLTAASLRLERES